MRRQASATARDVAENRPAILSATATSLIAASIWAGLRRTGGRMSDAKTVLGNVRRLKMSRRYL
jgi:hypothetical protein